MRREFTIQSRLAPVFPYVPAMVAFCDDESVIGSDFYVMERLDGTILRRDLPDGMTLDEDDARTLCSTLPRRPGRAARGRPRGRPGSSTSAAGAGYVGRQVGGWSDRFRHGPHRQRRRLRAR